STKAEITYSSWSSWTALARNAAGRTGRLLVGGGFAFSIMENGIRSAGQLKRRVLLQLSTTFKLTNREPVVQILKVYLEDMQRVSFHERDRLDTLDILKFSFRVRVVQGFKKLAPKTNQNEKSLGRLIYVHLSSCNLFYLRMLLCHKKGCKSSVEVRIVHDHILPTYRATCEALGLLGDDKEWDITLEESDVSGSSAEIRTLFSQILIYYDIADPGKLWTKHWQTIRDDIPAKVSKETGIPNYHVNTTELQGYILYELEAILNGFWEICHRFCLYAPLQHLLEDLKNKLLMEEKNYKRDLLMFKLPLELTNESLCYTKKKSRLGNGEIGELDEEENQVSSWITIPPEYFVTADEIGMEELIHFIYDEATLKTPTAGGLQEKAIVCPKNDTADAANAKILSFTEGHSKTCLSIDEAILIGRETSKTEMLYPMEYLNTITFPGFLPYELQLKVGLLIILLRNVNLSRGLCNDTRMIVRSLMSNLIEAQITGTRIDEEVTMQNNAIQANMDINNMDINNIDYFNPLFKPRTVYRFSNFICETTKPYHQTLENKVSLKFRKITRFDILTRKEFEFPEYHFEFIAYNQLASKVRYRDENSKMISSANSGNIIEFTMWDELVKQFNKAEIEKITPPIIISVSSYRVTNTKLTATPVTHYYINPRIPEAEYAHAMFKEKYSLNPHLQISKYRFEDPEQEKTRNKETLHTLLQQNPTSFKGVRFTCEVIITTVKENRDWNYPSCSQCSKGSTQQNGTYTYEDHGK
ncbi:DNA helicase, partial [Tanacetum coccineum]